MDDASLDDFLDGGDGEDEDRDEEATTDDGAGGGGDETAAADEEAPVEGDDAPTGDDEAADADGPTAGVEPATSTYAWSSAPVACAACGETVRRRWRDEAGLVCRDCKEW